MNSEKQIAALVKDWKGRGYTKTEIIIGTAEAEVGWCYVWGATGQQCTPAYRRQYAARTSCPAGEAKLTISKCQVTRDSNPKGNCSGCKWYPNSQRTLMDDCQGFVKQTAGRAGIRFTGAGCTSMWKNTGNWAARGVIETLPEQLCCVFWTDKDNKNVKSHIGWYIGNGMMIHCSGEVKKEKLSKKCTHWAIPKGLEGGELPVSLPVLKRGSKNEYVTKLQTMLIQRGYDVGKTGADGKFGAKTEEAVRKFQRDNGLEADGIIGKDTWAALQSSETNLFTVTIRNLSQSAADEIVKKYGGTMTKEGT